jgi:hypothetical protein
MIVGRKKLGRGICEGRIYEGCWTHEILYGVDSVGGLYGSSVHTVAEGRGQWADFGEESRRRRKSAGPSLTTVLWPDPLRPAGHPRSTHTHTR